MAGNIYRMDGQYEDYLKDESKYSGYADSISFPESKEEIAGILKELSQANIPVTIQGGKTGIVGGAVPQGGHAMNLSRMGKVLEAWMEEDGTGRIRVQPGITLADLRKELNQLFRENPQFWPVDPTESSATAGGIAASGAQGLCRVLYGRSSHYFESVDIMDYEGQVRTLHCGEQEVLGTKWEDGLGLALGMEGITGIITELTLKLLPKPQAVWGIAFFFEEDAQAAGFVDGIKEDFLNWKAAPAQETGNYAQMGSAGGLGASIWENGTDSHASFHAPDGELGASIWENGADSHASFHAPDGELGASIWGNGKASIAAVEYIGRESLAMLEDGKELISKLKEFPDIRPEIAAMVYLEIHGEEESIEELAERLMESAMEHGSDPDGAWAVSGEAEVEKLHTFRHAAAELTNLFVEKRHQEDGRITKLGADMMAGGGLLQALEGFRQELAEAGLKGCIFGHALENHLHVNILPESYEEYRKGIALMRRWAAKIKENHGILVGEHGVGKLKREILGSLLPEEYLEKCRKAKNKMDCAGMFNQGNILAK